MNFGREVGENMFYNQYPHHTYLRIFDVGAFILDQQYEHIKVTYSRRSPRYFAKALLINADFTLYQCLRRWVNIRPKLRLGQHIVFSERPKFEIPCQHK